MAGSQSEVVNQLVIRVEKLVQMHSQLLRTHSELQERHIELEQELQLKDNEMQELEQKYQSLKMAKAIEANGEDVHSTKIRLNRMVREIDKCIALLNK